MRGYDPRDFVVYAYGGAGPLHAFAFAKELGVKGVVVPLGNGASTLSAYGCSTSNLVLNVEKEELFFAPFPAARMNALLAELEKQARDSMLEMGKTRRRGGDRALRAHALQRAVAAQPARAHALPAN